MLGLGLNENRLNDASTKNMIVRTLKKVSELFEEKKIMNLMSYLRKF